MRIPAPSGTGWADNGHLVRFEKEFRMSTPSLQDWLARHRIWGLASADARQRLQEMGETLSFAEGALVRPATEWGDELWIVLEGQVVLEDHEAPARHQVLAGEHFGALTSPDPLPLLCHVQASAASRLLRVPGQTARQLAQTESALLPFLPLAGLTAPAARAPSGQTPAETNLFSMRLGDLARHPPITLAPTASVLEAARTMRERGVSSILLMQDGLLFGLITDRDLRNRVVAEGLSLQAPIADIATLAPMTLDLRSPAFEALLMMARHNIHHIPVMDGQQVHGMVTATDLTQQHSTSAVYMAGDIHGQKDLAGLVRVSQRIRTLQQHLAASHASAYSTGHVITTITDAITQRLIHLTEAELGPAPVDYVWVAAGSQARCEQTAKSDQDNCLMLDDAYDPAQHGEYFRTFSRRVCDGLAACGYIHCPGEMMAMTDAWRQPMHQWREYFRKWVQVPESKALMLCSVFFDLRAIHGRHELLDTLRAEVLGGTRGNSLFLAHMVSNALKLRPPLGLFGQISATRSGEHAGTVDIKHNGIAPIVDLARIYALAGGLTPVNTHDRLEIASETGEVSPQSARDLRDALEFIGSLRIAHHSRRLQAGLEPDNYPVLKELSNFERGQLKDAFSLIQSMQSVLAQRYKF